MNSNVMERAGQPSRYYEMVAKVRAELQNTESPSVVKSNGRLDTVYITSIENLLHNGKGGVVFEAPPSNAAERITQQSHRLSTADEVRRYKGERQADVDLFARREEARMRTTSLKPTEEENARTAAIVASAVQSVMQSQTGRANKEART